MTKAFTVAQVRSRLSEWVATHGKESAAQHFGVSASFIGKVQRGDEEPSDKILRGLNLMWAAVPRTPLPPTEDR